MAANKSNPNLSQAQYLALSSRVNAATGFAAKSELFKKRLPKEPASVLAARKLIKEFETKQSAVHKAVEAELEKAKNIAMDSVLFGTAETAIAAVKALEGKYRG
jgi:hypothetical protein